MTNEGDSNLNRLVDWKLSSWCNREFIEACDVEPNWPNLFDFASQLARDGLTVGEGQELVVEMLAYGRRLHDAASRPKTTTEAVIRVPVKRPVRSRSAAAAGLSDVKKAELEADDYSLDKV